MNFVKNKIIELVLSFCFTAYMYIYSTSLIFQNNLLSLLIHGLFVCFFLLSFLTDDQKRHFNDLHMSGISKPKLI